MNETMKQALTIAGSDSGGGAGIQADIKAFHANGVFGMSVITSITAQNTRAVIQAFDLPVEIIEAQLDAVFDDFDIAAVKTGMLSSQEIVEAVAAKLRSRGAPNLVVDPVMISKSGYPLLKPEAIESVKRYLLPLATVVTPNAHEAARLASMQIQDLEDAKEAARKIMDFGPRSVIVKGGHVLGATDVLFDGTQFTLFEGELIDTRNTHGTGCTYSAALAAHLAQGKELNEAVGCAKQYISNAIRHALPIGHGCGPTNHFYFLSRTNPL